MSAEPPPQTPTPIPRSVTISASPSVSTTQSQQVSLSRAASRGSRRPRVPQSPAPQSVEVRRVASDEEVTQVLHSIGYAQYASLFAKANLSGRTLHSLSNAELRDDLGIHVLRHRREILSAFSTLHPPANTTSVPEFGRILVHLSNERTFHSWLRTAVQTVVFSSALLRLSPHLRQTALTNPVAFAFVGVAFVWQIYGAGRYWAVTQGIEQHRNFRPDTWGTSGLFLVSLGIAAICLYIILQDGFWPE